MAEPPHAIKEIQRLRRALEHAVHILHYAEEHISGEEDRERVQDARRKAQRELDQNKVHYDPHVDADI